MFEISKSSPAVTLLKEDHDRVKRLFVQFETAKGRPSKRKVLIAELDVMNGSESHFEAKFVVLAENVRHHIKEEENEMLPKAKAVKINFDSLAEKMKRRKERLLTDGVPVVGEETMVKASRGKGDSSAKGAKRKAPKVSKRKKR